MASIYLYPNSAGDSTTMQIIACPTPQSNWKAARNTADYTNLTLGSTYLLGNNTSTYKKDLYNIDETSETGTITSVIAHWYWLQTRAGSYTATIQPILKLSSTELTGSEFTTISTTAVSGSEALSRPGGGSWSFSDLADLQIGYNAKRHTSGYFVEVCAFYLEVQYTPSGGGGYSNKFCGVSIGSICGISSANISKVCGV